MLWLLADGGGSEWLPLQMTPIHPILVNFTAALVPVSFAAEVLGRWFKKPSLTGTAWWTLLAAALVTPLTAAAGWYWKNQMDMPGNRAQMAIHQWLGISLAVLLVAMTVWRGQLFRRDRTPGCGYLAVLGVLVGLLTLQGHLGGAMSFGDGDANPADDPSPAPRAGMTTPGMNAPVISRPPATSPTHDHETPATTTAVVGKGTAMPATTIATSPTSAHTADADGWLDSIHVKGK